MTATETTALLRAEASATPASALPFRPAVPVLLLAAGAVVGLAAAHGGYFPTSWGLGAILLLWSTGLWAALSGRTDAGWVDLGYLGLLAALTAWVGLSIFWSLVPSQTVLELERTGLLLAAVAALLVLARREDVPRLAGVMLAAIVAVCVYALATRLFPERLGSYEPISGVRLSEPLGYWNALGAFAAMGSLLALGIASDARGRWPRVGAAASLVVLSLTLYFTYSRGAWLALGIGGAVLVAVAPRRLRTIVTGAVLAIAPATTVAIASSSYALTHVNVPLARAKDAGHRLALVVGLLLVAAGALALVLDFVQRRVAVPRSLRLGFASALAALVLSVTAGIVVRFGGPAEMARDAWHAFEAPPPAASSNLNARLFNFSGNRRAELWVAAREEYARRPLAGDGAGTFERVWQGRRDAVVKVRDAHGLYFEALAELGTVGLVLVALLLLLPLAAGLVVRRSAFLPGILAAYSVFVVHAGVDWDWELSAVALTALFLGALPVIAVRRRDSRFLGSTARTAACVAVVAASVAMAGAFLGNAALDRAEDAVAANSYAEAVDEADRARRLMPWSPWPLIARGDAELGAGQLPAAERSFRRAISVDRGEWRAWLGLAFATKGRTRLAAFQEAGRLYPRSGELREAATKLFDETND